MVQAFAAHSAESHATDNQELKALLPDRASCLDAKMVKEMSSPTHSWGRGRPVLGRDGMAVWQKSQTSVDSQM